MRRKKKKKGSHYPDAQSVRENEREEIRNPPSEAFKEALVSFWGFLSPGVVYRVLSMVCKGGKNTTFPSVWGFCPT